MNQEEEFDHEAWGELSYEAPDYVPGSHPMDSDDVTWHHVWEKPKEPKKKLGRTHVVATKFDGSTKANTRRKRSP